jgi:hypothetical protein
MRHDPRADLRSASLALAACGLLIVVALVAREVAGGGDPAGGGDAAGQARSFTSAARVSGATGSQAAL